MSEFLSTNIPKFTSVFTAIGAFFVVLAVIFAIAGRANGKKARPIALVILLRTRSCFTSCWTCNSRYTNNSL
jgi:alpha-glucoside transport system permease protein